MELVPPAKISGEILSLIDEADHKLVIVSPYIKISGWNKLTTRISKLSKRNIPIEVFVRDEQNNSRSYEELTRVGITPFLIPNLHAKLYFNEKRALVTSMNLLRYSDERSIEIGYITETEAEIEDIRNFYSRFIEPYKKSSDYSSLTLEDEVYNRLSEQFPKIRMFMNFKELVIQVNNRYEVVVDKNHLGQNVLVISAILSGKEYEKRNDLIKSANFPNKLSLECSEGGNGYYDQVFGVTESEVQSSQINKVISREKVLFADLISSFIKSVEEFKKNVYGR